MSKHSGTKWFQPINADFFHVVIAKDDSNPFNPNATKTICTVEKFKHPDEKSEANKALQEESRANAKLITSAPELYTALTNLVNNITLASSPTEENREPTEFENAVTAARALLASIG